MMQPKFRVSAQEEDALKQAAAHAGMTVSAFAKHAALEAAGVAIVALNERRLLIGADEPNGMTQILTTGAGEKLRVVRARICPTPGCVWRKFDDPSARCPDHGVGVDQ